MAQISKAAPAVAVPDLRLRRDNGLDVVSALKRKLSAEKEQKPYPRIAVTTRCIVPNRKKEKDMSVKGEIKEGAGFVKEEMNEHGKSPESQRKAQEGRDLRNEGRVEDGKAPKTTKPGTGHPEK